jgi:hypothetical protein
MMATDLGVQKSRPRQASASPLATHTITVSAS